MFSWTKPAEQPTAKPTPPKTAFEKSTQLQRIRELVNQLHDKLKALAKLGEHAPAHKPEYKKWNALAQVVKKMDDDITAYNQGEYGDATKPSNMKDLCNDLKDSIPGNDSILKPALNERRHYGVSTFTSAAGLTSADAATWQLLQLLGTKLDATITGLNVAAGPAKPGAAGERDSDSGDDASYDSDGSYSSFDEDDLTVTMKAYLTELEERDALSTKVAQLNLSAEESRRLAEFINPKTGMVYDQPVRVMGRLYDFEYIKTLDVDPVSGDEFLEDQIQPARDVYDRIVGILESIKDARQRAVTTTSATTVTTAITRPSAADELSDSSSESESEYESESYSDSEDDDSDSDEINKHYGSRPGSRW